MGIVMMESRAVIIDGKREGVHMQVCTPSEHNLSKESTILTGCFFRIEGNDSAGVGRI